MKILYVYPNARLKQGLYGDMFTSRATGAKPLFWLLCGCTKASIFSSFLSFLFLDYSNLSARTASPKITQFQMTRLCPKSFKVKRDVLGSSARLLVKPSMFPFAQTKSVIIACTNGLDYYTCPCFAASQKCTGDAIMSGRKGFHPYFHAEKKT